MLSLLHLAFLSDDFSTGISLRAPGLSPNPASTRNSLARGGLEQMDSLDVVLVTWAVAGVEYFTVKLCCIFLQLGAAFLFAFFFFF